jgi:hypothetical protein
MKSRGILILIGILLIGLASLLLYINAQKSLATAGDEKANQIITTYLQSKSMNIQPNTEEYSRFMKGILLGEYPDLTGNGSIFIKSQQEADLIINFAARHMKINQKGVYKGTDIPEAPNR